VRAVGESDEQIHLGAQLNVVAGVAEFGPPHVTAIVFDAHRREEAEGERNVAAGEAELAGDEHEIVTGVAGQDARVARGVRGSCRAADQSVMGARGILDHREHHPAHVGKDHPPLGDGGSPLDFYGVGEVEALAWIGGVPGDEGNRGRTMRLGDADRFAAFEARRKIPAARDGLGVNDAIRRDRRRG